MNELINTSPLIDLSLSFPPDGRLRKSSSAYLKSIGVGYCSKCGETKPLDDFPKSSGKRYFYCKTCTKRNNREYARGRGDKQKDRYADLKRPFIEALGGKCCRCGYDTYLSALDFHHVAPETKKFNLSKIFASTTKDTIPYKEVMAEANKCALLCANCHRAYESGEWQAEWVKRDTVGWEPQPIYDGS